MPNVFSPIAVGTPPDQLIAIINGNFAQLDNEVVTKVFKQANGNAIIEGKLPYDGGYGTLYYDANGIPSTIIGILPDGSTGIAIAKPGVSVLSAFS